MKVHVLVVGRSKWAYILNLFVITSLSNCNLHKFSVQLFFAINTQFICTVLVRCLFALFSGWMFDGLQVYAPSFYLGGTIAFLGGTLILIPIFNEQCSKVKAQYLEVAQEVRTTDNRYEYSLALSL